MQTLHETMNLISPVDPPRAGRNAATRAVLISGPIMVLVCLVLCLFSVATPTELTAQEPVADANAAALTALDDASLSDTERVILRTVQESDPKTGVELAKAASVLIEIEMYNDARFYLGKIEALNLDQAKMFELNDQVGSDFFLFIHTNARLQPEGESLARKVMVASRSESSSPARMNQLIKTLSDENVSVRSDAFRKLRRLGEPAVAAMLNVFAQPERSSEYPGIRGALMHMGVHAQGPLLGAAYASDVQVQAESIRALGSFESTEANDALMWASLSPKSPAASQRYCFQSHGSQWSTGNRFQCA